MTATRRTGRGQSRLGSALPYASLQLRIVAFILDTIVLASCFMLFVAAGGLQTLLRSDFGDVDPPESAYYIWLGFILAFIPFAFLYFALLWFWRGQSVGMMAVHIAVARRNGEPLSMWRALGRALAWALSLLPLGLGVLPALFDREHRALHDRLADTTVRELP